MYAAIRLHALCILGFKLAGKNYLGA